MTTTQKQKQYTSDDAGCYVDGAAGVYYMGDRIVEIAEAHGFTAERCNDNACPRCVHGAHVAGDGTYTEWTHCRFASELEDEATNHMNDTCPVDGYYWGFSDGDWGLWPAEEDD